MRILLVEDDLEQAEALKRSLQKAGYVVEMAHNGTDGQFLGDEEQFDAVILDLGLPEIPGLEVLRHWRQKGNHVPVIILTARDAWHERVDGLNAGADDYLGKPFHADEVIARLQAVVRRTVGKADNVLEWKGVRLLLAEQQAIAQDGRVITLTSTDFRLLRHFMMYPDKVHSKSYLSEQVYEEEQIKDSNVIEVYVNRLRNYFGKDFIKTQWGKGYRIGE
ncbi:MULTISPECIES: response regulator transcription factor [Amphritea]|uniref:Two component transcriptional regulator, winged helix family n=2 Tax=Amphritea TaxID=515417 RepID=A0A1H9CNN8_9GAMM|nr:MULTISPECIES: response regulator transcription factor [Amphritea]MBN0988987.1 response regulator transcription factor [Amphritea pacifica]MBN1009033.1 response regulator transcription factor [Amphritea pacifica]SEQ02283.1 two component transcriptional regulator, winged helix family [Amphritea atlantica]